MAWASLSLLFFVGLSHVVVFESLVELQAVLLQRRHHQSPLLDLVNSVPDNLDHANLKSIPSLLQMKSMMTITWRVKMTCLKLNISVLEDDGVLLRVLEFVH